MVIEGMVALQHLELERSNLLAVEMRNSLITAAQNGNVNIVEALLKAGANINGVARYELMTTTAKYVSKSCNAPFSFSDISILTQRLC